MVARVVDTNNQLIYSSAHADPGVENRIFVYFFKRQGVSNIGG
jgi:hypothetical protein